MIFIFNTIGVSKINLHKVRLPLCSDNTVRLRYYDKIVCVKDGDRLLKHSIANNIATVLEPGYTEGNEVDVWLYCFRASEGGGITPMVIHETDEVIMSSLL